MSSQPYACDLQACTHTVTSMSEQVIRLVYPPDLLKSPIINRLIERYQVTVNILRAHINAQEGWMVVQLIGQDAVIEEAAAWLRGQGIEVQVMSA